MTDYSKKMNTAQAQNLEKQEHDTKKYIYVCTECGKEFTSEYETNIKTWDGKSLCNDCFDKWQIEECKHTLNMLIEVIKDLIITIFNRLIKKIFRKERKEPLIENLKKQHYTTEEVNEIYSYDEE